MGACTCTKKLRYCDGSCRESERTPEKECRICDGPCIGIQYHEAIKTSWTNQEPVTEANYAEYMRNRQINLEQIKRQCDTTK